MTNSPRLTHWRQVDTILAVAGHEPANLGEIRRNQFDGDPPLVTAALIGIEREGAALDPVTARRIVNAVRGTGALSPP